MSEGHIHKPGMAGHVVLAGSGETSVDRSEKSESGDEARDMLLA